MIKASRGLAYTEFDEPEILIFYLGKLGRSDNCIMDNLDWFKKKLKDKKDPWIILSEFKIFLGCLIKIHTHFSVCNVNKELELLKVNKHIQFTIFWKKCPIFHRNTWNIPAFFC